MSALKATYSIETPYSPDDIPARFTGELGAPRVFGGPPYYRGTVDPTGFRIFHRSHNSYAMSPNVTGRYQQVHGGTVVHVEVSPIVANAVLSLLGRALATALGALLAIGLGGFVGVGLAVACLAIVPMWFVSFRLEVRTSRNDLIRILGGRLVPRGPTIGEADSA